MNDWRMFFSSYSCRSRHLVRLCHGRVSLCNFFNLTPRYPELVEGHIMELLANRFRMTKKLSRHGDSLKRLMGEPCRWRHKNVSRSALKVQGIQSWLLLVGHSMPKEKLKGVKTKRREG